MARRDFKKPDGSVVSLDEADFGAAEKRGYVPFDAKREEAGEHPIQAALEGAARSATFGISDKALAFNGAPAGAADPALAEGLRLRKEENPVASQAGEVAGLFTPGPGAVAKGAGRLVEAGVNAGVNKSLVRAAAYGAEGGLYGLGSAISEDAMGDPKLASDHIAANVLGGALAGTATGVVLGKFGDLGRSALMKAFGGQPLKERLSQLAEESVMHAVTVPSDMARDQLRGRANEVGRYAIDNGFAKAGSTFGDAAERAASHAQDTWKTIEHTLETAQQLKPFDAAAAGLKMQSVVEDVAHNPAMKAERKRLLQIVEDMSNPDEAPKSYAEAWEMSKDLLAKAGHGQSDSPIKGELAKLRDELRGSIFGQVAEADPALGETLQAANRNYSNAATFRDLATAKADRAGRGFTLGDLYAGGAGAMTGGPIGLAAPFISRAARERGGFVAGAALDAMAESKTLERIAQGFQLMMKAKLTDPGFGGPFRATLESAAANSADALLKTHLALAQTDPSYMPTVGLEHEDPSTIADYADKAHRLGRMASAVDAGSAEIDKSVRRVLGEQPGRTPAPMRMDRPATVTELEALKSKLKALASDDGHVSRAITELAPTTAGLAQMSVQAGARHLLDTAPKDLTEGLPPALRRPWHPNQSEIRTWMRRVDVVADPRAVLDAMREGLATPEQVETLGTVYPALQREFKERIMARLSEWKEPMDRAQRSRLEVLIGDLEDPAVTALIQAAHHRSIPPMAGKPDGREKIDAAKNMETQAQRLEGRTGVAQ